MATLERVMQMKEQGLSENQIVQTLRQEGVAPREIEESLSQSKIKSALVGEQQTMENQEQGMSYDQDFAKSNFQDQSAPAPNDQSNVQQVTQEYYPEYQPQTYQDYQPQQPFDIETINEMIEQAIEEKTDNLKKQIASFTRFKEDSAIAINQMNERLTKIENTIGELQISVIRKIGEYGQDIHTIAKEMQETQDTFSKVVNPLTDSIRDLRQITNTISPQQVRQIQQQTQKSQQPERQTTSKTKDGFENFLR